MSLLEAISAAWVMEPRTLTNLAELVRLHENGVKVPAEQVQKVVDGRDEARAASRPWDSVLASRTPAEQKQGFYMVGSVAVVPIEGVLAARAGMVNNVSSPSGMSAEEVIKSVNGAAEVCKAMVLHMDSPGGTVAGTTDMAQAIADVAARMPVVALANNKMCSGAYWLGCQATKIMASPLAEVGSIGVYAAVADTSRAAEDAGVKVHVVNFGENKGAFTDGTVVTDKQLSDLKTQLAPCYAQFIATVAKGRGVTKAQAAELADGRVHMAPDALAFGLIDKIGNLKDAVAWASALSSQTPATAGSARKTAMTLDELKNTQPGLLADFRKEVLAEATAAEADRTKAAVTEALAAEAAKTPPAASIEEIEAAVPATMASRDTMVLGLVKSKATLAQAQAKVSEKLAADNATLTTQLAAAQKVNEGLGKNGLATSPLTFKPAQESDAGAFEQIVLAIAARDKCSIEVATGKACNDKDNNAAREDWVARKCPKIKAA